jgi:hypothetical protein
MSFDDQIRELCDLAANTKDPASMFRALHELDLIREHKLPNKTEVAITEQRASNTSRRSPKVEF